MDIMISNASNTPIYEQIVRQVKAQILSDTLREGDAMPSIRALARSLRISVITTKRAYEELSRDGFLCPVPGKGYFVAPQNRETRREAALCRVEEHLTHALAEAKSAAISLAELTNILQILYEDEQT